MDSCQQLPDKKGDTDESVECLVTEDFADDRNGLNRFSLIELILPFAEESKFLANSDGLLPW